VRIAHFDFNIIAFLAMRYHVRNARNLAIIFYGFDKMFYQVLPFYVYFAFTMLFLPSRLGSGQLNFPFFPLDKFFTLDYTFGNESESEVSGSLYGY